jgi:hypothetical protein
MRCFCSVQKVHHSSLAEIRGQPAHRGTLSGCQCCESDTKTDGKGEAGQGTKHLFGRPSSEWLFCHNFPLKIEESLTLRTREARTPVSHYLHSLVPGPRVLRCPHGSAPAHGHLFLTEAVEQAGAHERRLGTAIVPLCFVQAMDPRAAPRRQPGLPPNGYRMDRAWQALPHSAFANPIVALTRSKPDLPEAQSREARQRMRRQRRCIAKRAQSNWAGIWPAWGRGRAVSSEDSGGRWHCTRKGIQKARRRHSEANGLLWFVYCPPASAWLIS